MKLNKLSSISGAGVGGSKLDMECYSCGERGHAKRECSRRRKRNNDDERSGAAKKTKSSLTTETKARKISYASSGGTHTYLKH